MAVGFYGRKPLKPDSMRRIRALLVAVLRNEQRLGNPARNVAELSGMPVFNHESLADWRALRVSSNTRWAIYDKTFPAHLDAALTEYPEVLDAFDQDAAVDVLLAVAGAWPTLGRNLDDQDVRYTCAPTRLKTRCSWQRSSPSASASSRSLSQRSKQSRSADSTLTIRVTGWRSQHLATVRKPFNRNPRASCENRTDDPSLPSR